MRFSRGVAISLRLFSAQQGVKACPEAEATALTAAALPPELELLPAEGPNTTMGGSLENTFRGTADERSAILTRALRRGRRQDASKDVALVRKAMIRMCAVVTILR
jgi:hypothetical protein